MRRRRGSLAAALALAAILVVTAGPATGSAAAGVPPIKHVFIVVLENERADTSFGPDSPATYLNHSLLPAGAFVPNYYGIGHQSLTNYVAMVGGQAPNPATQSDCQFYMPFVAVGQPGANGQLPGAGCVYPPGTETIANYLEGAGYTWKGYMEDMAPADGPADAVTCRRPKMNSQDGTQKAKVGDQYAARHNPFVYFSAITGDGADGSTDTEAVRDTCNRNDVDFRRMATDLQSESTTPNYSLIVPNLCDDGHDAVCADGSPGGLARADGWLQQNIPAILASPAYRDHGLLIVTFDESEVDTPTLQGDFTACCNEMAGPNSPSPGGVGGGPGSGGGRVGAVMLSPCIRPGTVTQTAYNHYSMLRSVEDMFGVPYLGFSGQQGLVSFGPDVFTAPACGAPPLVCSTKAWTSSHRRWLRRHATLRRRQPARWNREHHAWHRRHPKHRC
jgi:hypothetical protein